MKGSPPPPFGSHMTLSRVSRVLVVLASASAVLASPAAAQQLGFTPPMLAELLRNGVAEEKILAMVGSGCLAKPLSAADGTDLRGIGGSPDLLTRLGRACLVGEGAASVSSRAGAASPAAASLPVAASRPVAAVLPAAASLPVAAVQQLSPPVSTPPAAPEPAPVAVPSSAKEKVAADTSTPREVIPTATTTLDVSGLGAVKASLDFFECPALSATPARYLGPASDRFDSRLARFLCARVKFASAQPASATPSLKLQCKYALDGGTLAVGEIDGTPSAGAAVWEAYIQYGKDDYDHWKDGQYTVTCDYGAATVLRAPFAVFTSGTSGDDIPSLKARVLTLRTFATGSQVVPLMERAYTDVFVGEKLRMVGMELQLLYPAPDGKTSETVSCVWKHVDSSKLMYTDQLVVAPTAESSTSIKAAANGFTDTGGWTSGTYTVECGLADKVIASTRFVVK